MSATSPIPLVTNRGVFASDTPSGRGGMGPARALTVMTVGTALFAIASTAFIVRAIAADGKTTWFEGLLLVGVYVLFALAFYFESPT